MTLTVMLQEPRRFVVEATAAVLERSTDAHVVLAATDPADLASDEAPDADVAVLSVETEERALLRTVRALQRRRRDIRMVGTFRRASWAPTDSEVFRYVTALVAQEDGTAALLPAIRGEGGSGPEIWRFREHTRPARPPVLTPREHDVLALLAGGFSAQEASDRLQISRKTVENHKQRMFSKLGVQSQAHAVATAMRSGALATLPESLSG